MSRGLLWKLFFWVDYLYKTLITLFFLLKEKPTHVFAVSPPSFCPMICWFYCKISGIKLAVDAHNRTFSKRWISVPFIEKVLHSADIVIVHNDEFYRYLKTIFPQIRFFILQDKIPSLLSRKEDNTFISEKYFLAVLSYYDDEPVEQILIAAKKYLEVNGINIKFKLTGNYLKKKHLYRKYSSVNGIEFLGFVDQSTYNQLVVNAFGIIALTIEDMLQQCASIEAMGAGIPLIISNTDTNRRLFFKGAVITDIDPISIKRSFEIFVKDKEKLLLEMRELKIYWEEQWNKAFAKLGTLMK